MVKWTRMVLCALLFALMVSIGTFAECVQIAEGAWPGIILIAVAMWRLFETLPTTPTRAGACTTCGYDRHGLAARTPCPECAEVPLPRH